jgi:hypothetical protein
MFITAIVYILFIKVYKIAIFLNHVFSSFHFSALFDRALLLQCNIYV